MENQNMTPMDYLTSISPAAPELPQNQPIVSAPPRKAWFIIGLVIVLMLALVLLALGIVGISSGASDNEAEAETPMFEMTVEDETLPELSTDYEAIGNYSEGLVAAIRKADNNTVFLDSAQRTVFVFDDEKYNLAAYEYHDGRLLISCKQDDPRFGYLDKTGKLVIACEYSYATSFNDGEAQVLNRKPADGDKIEIVSGKIDINGKMLESSTSLMDAAKEVSL